LLDAFRGAGADVYLVSNIAGSPSGKTNDGFISRLTPDGNVQELRWIQGGQGGVAMHAPKGMVIRGEMRAGGEALVARRMLDHAARAGRAGGAAPGGVGGGGGGGPPPPPAPRSRASWHS
jgi:hypothetical protein